MIGLFVRRVTPLLLAPGGRAHSSDLLLGDRAAQLYAGLARCLKTNRGALPPQPAEQTMDYVEAEALLRHHAASYVGWSCDQFAGIGDTLSTHVAGDSGETHEFCVCSWSRCTVDVLSRWGVRGMCRGIA